MINDIIEKIESERERCEKSIDDENALGHETLAAYYAGMSEGLLQAVEIIRAALGGIPKP